MLVCLLANYYIASQLKLPVSLEVAAIAQALVHCAIQLHRLATKAHRSQRKA